MTDTPRDLPPNWSEIDAVRSYYEYVREIGRQVHEGAPLPASMRSQRKPDEIPQGDIPHD